MKNKVEDLLVTIENHIRNGKLQLAKKELSHFSKSKKLGPLERIKLAQFHMRLGQTYKAIRAINKELAPSEFNSATINELCEQAMLAHILNQIGAQKYAKRLLKMINEITKERNINLSSVLPELDRFMGNIHFSNYDYESALPFYERVLERIGNPESYRYNLARIGIADALDGMGKSNEAIKIVTDILAIAGSDQELLKAICYQARGEYYFRRGKKGDNALARGDFDVAATYFDDKTDTKDYAFLNKWSGILRMEEGDTPRALVELSKSLEILQTSKNRPTTYFEVFYWLEKVPGYSAPIEDQIALRSHPLPSPFGVLAGKVDSNLDDISNPWLKKIAKNVDFNEDTNCWLITDDEIKDYPYHQLYNEVIDTDDHELIDLLGGVFKYKDSTFRTISENQSYALLSIIGSGSLGISQWSLIDNIYGQSFYDPISGIERINKTVEQLRKNGFEICRKNNHYFYTKNKGVKIIIPRDMNIKGVSGHFRIKNKKFKRIMLEETYGIKKATANIWVKNWEQDNIIKKFGVGKSSYYEFID